MTLQNWASEELKLAFLYQYSEYWISRLLFWIILSKYEIDVAYDMTIEKKRKGKNSIRDTIKLICSKGKVLITCALWWFIWIVTTVVTAVTEDVEIDAASRRATELRQRAAGSGCHPFYIHKQRHYYHDEQDQLPNAWHTPLQLHPVFKI